MNFSLQLPPGYSLFQTVQVLRRTARNVVDRWEQGRYVRALPTTAGDAIVLVRQHGELAEVEVGLQVAESDAAAQEIGKALRRILGLDTNLTATPVAFAFDPALSTLAERMKGMRPPRFVSLFESIASVVPFQQLSLESGMALMARLVRRFGRSIAQGEHRAWIFPEPEMVGDAPSEDIVDCGFSRSKAATLRHAARLIAEGNLSESQLDGLPSAEVIERLDDLPGIGPWSAALIALRGLGRLDVFPQGDTGVRRALAGLLGRPTPLTKEEEQALVKRLGPVCGLLYFYALGWRLAKAHLLDEPAGPAA